jgi:hypothetical protein
MMCGAATDFPGARDVQAAKEVFQRLDDALEQCDCLVDVCRARRGGRQDETAAAEREGALFARFEAVATTLAPLIECGLVDDAAARATVGLFKGITRALRELALAKRVADLEGLRRLVETLAAALTPVVEAHLLRTAVENQRTSAAEMKREARMVPEIVFSAEQFEVALFKLAKVVPAVDFMTKLVKRAQARDFKLDTDKAVIKKRKRKAKRDGETPEEDEEEAEGEE